MSKLEDNQNVPCTECNHRLNNITFCKTIMRTATFDGIQYNRRCPRIICETCEYCSHCMDTILDRKKRMRLLRSGYQRVEYDYEKKFLMDYYGVEYDCV